MEEQIEEQTKEHDFFRKICGEIVRMKYPDYPKDSWGEDWVGFFYKEGYKISECKYIYIKGATKIDKWDKNSPIHYEFRIIFHIDNKIFTFDSDGGWWHEHIRNEFKYSRNEFEYIKKIYNDEIKKNECEVRLYIKEN